MEVCRELRIKLKELFERAAKWVNEAFGQRIKNGAIREAIGKYRRRRFIPDWVLRYIDKSARPIHA